MEHQETTTKADKCCPVVPAGRRKAGIVGFFAGLGAAFLASLCCFGPLLAIVLGISGAATLAGVAKYQPILVTAAAAIVVAVGFYFWRSNRQFWKPFLISLATFGAFLLLIYQVLIPMLSRHIANESRPASTQSVSQVPGNNATVKEATYTIAGMTCVSCAATIERILADVPGIQSASVSYETKTAKIVYDAQLVDPNQIPSVIAKVGYQAKLVRL